MTRRFAGFLVLLALASLGLLFSSDPLTAGPPRAASPSRDLQHEASPSLDLECPLASNPTAPTGPRHTARPPSGLVETVAQATGSGPQHITAEEGASRLADILAAADRSADVLALGRAVAQDETMLELLVVQARRMLAAGEGLVRTRGVLILAALGQIDSQDWYRHILAEPDAEARARLVASPPFIAADPVATRGSLLELALHDPAAAVREAAVVSLPAGLTATETDVLLGILRSDREPMVRLRALAYFRGASDNEAEALTILLETTRNAEQPDEVRRAAAYHLLELEDGLAAAGASSEELHALLLAFDTE